MSREKVLIDALERIAGRTDDYLPYCTYFERYLPNGEVVPPYDEIAEAALVAYYASATAPTGTLAPSALNQRESATVPTAAYEAERDVSSDDEIGIAYSEARRRESQ